jgi:hypothetical protein
LGPNDASFVRKLDELVGIGTCAKKYF